MARHPFAGENLAHKLKMNAEQGASIAQMLSAAAQNENQLASLGAGLGQNLGTQHWMHRFAGMTIR